MNALKTILESSIAIRAITASDAKTVQYVHIENCDCGMYDHHGQEMTEEQRTVYATFWTERLESNEFKG